MRKKKKKNANLKSLTSTARKDQATEKKFALRELTPTLCDQLQRELFNACQSVAKSYGLVVEGGELSDIDLRNSFSIDFRVGIPLSDGKLYSSDKALFEALAPQFGLMPSDYQKTFFYRSDVYKIVAINPNRPKYPIIANRVADGKTFKFTANSVAAYLQNHYSI